VGVGRQDHVKSRCDAVKTPRIVAPAANAGLMSLASAALVIAVVALVVYLLASLIYPERF
jgi:K+-transporting ATPase KdpF subunit